MEVNFDMELEKSLKPGNFEPIDKCIDTGACTTCKLDVANDPKVLAEVGCKCTCHIRYSTF